MSFTSTALSRSAEAEAPTSLRLRTHGLNRVTTTKSGPHRPVFRFELPSGTVFVKHFKAAHWWDVIRNTIRGTQAAREAQAAAEG